MRILLASLFLAAVAFAQRPATSFRFDFEEDVPPDAMYTAARGWGYERGTGPREPYYFSVAVPEEGNYKVTVTLGSHEEPSVTTVKAELRRLMLEQIRLPATRYATRSFIVNVRTPKIPGGGEVRLKDREKTTEAWAWDRRITLEIAGSRPALARLEIEKADHVPTIFIAGDSTSTDQPLEPFNSWGQMLTRFLNAEIAVANHGESGESLRGFLAERRLDKLLSVIRAGDWLFIQMGHNDQKEKGEGVGAFTTYKADLKRFVAEARTRSATPVLITPVNRLSFEPGGAVIVNSLGDYPEAVRQVAREENVALLDLNALSKAFYEALGPDRAHLAFAGNDKTHHSDYGSYQLARCIVQAIKDARLPLARYLLDVPAFDPAHPPAPESFDVPAEPVRRVETPYGK